MEDFERCKSTIGIKESMSRGERRTRLEPYKAKTKMPVGLWDIETRMEITGVDPKIKEQRKKMEPYCVVCHEDRPCDCHHIIYIRYGREHIDDVIMLCTWCHWVVSGMVHGPRNQERELVGQVTVETTPTRQKFTKEKVCLSKMLPIL